MLSFWLLDICSTPVLPKHFPQLRSRFAIHDPATTSKYSFVSSLVCGCSSPEMSFLSNLVAALAQNVQILEAELQTEGESTMPYLREPQLYNVMDDPTKLPSWKVFQAMESICADAKALQSAVTPNRSKLLSIAMSATKAASLQTAADLGVADAIEERGGSASLGILAKNLEVNENKLGPFVPERRL